MRKLASIQKIKEIIPIKDADKIEIAKVLGWQVVVRKGQFKPGDLAVYFEIDSFLPVRPEFEFLRDRSYRKNELLGEGFLLKTMKMRGELSQGLLMSLKEIRCPSCENFTFDEVVYKEDGEAPRHLYEGDDVTQMLGVKEWEIPERVSSGGTIVGQANKYIHVTDETRVQSMEGLLEEFKGKSYYITTKLDGSSHSVCVDKEGKFHVFGHNYEYKDDNKSSFYRFVKKHNIEELLRAYMEEHNLESMTIQGELCGAGIQGNKLKLVEADWYFFTIDENGKRVGLNEMENFLQFSIDKKNPLKMVPVQEVGDDLLKTYPNIDALLERAATDSSNIYQGGEPEGIVIRPLEPVYSPLLGASLSMKVINNKYLLKDKD